MANATKVGRGTARVLPWAAAVSVAVLLVQGCGLRTPNGVRIDQRTVNSAVDEPDIRKLPPGPMPGASPQDLVSGFMEAAAADPDHITAQEFLADGAVWSDQDAATVYDPTTVSAPLVSMKGRFSDVRLTMQAVASVSNEGVFRPATRHVDVTYRLRKVDGQWRLSYVPPGVLLTPRDLARAYRSIRTYGFSASRQVLVAEPGYVTSDRAGLAGATIHELVSGWGGAVDTSGPNAGGLNPGLTVLGSVVVRDGEATVDLGKEAFQVSQDRRPLLISQIAASLTSVPGVFSVRVLVEDRSYAGGAVPVSVADPLMATSKGPVLTTSATGQLVSLTGTKAAAVRWVGRDHGAEPLLAYPLAAPSGGRLAALRNATSGVELTVADLTGGPALSATERAEIPLPQQLSGSYLAPQWLDDARILLASGGPRPTVQLVDARRPKLRLVATPGLAALGPLSTFAVSRDGTRVMAVAGQPGTRQLYVGRITPAAGSADGMVTLGSWTQVPTGLADVAAASWSADLAAAVVGKPATLGAAPRAEVVALDTVSDPTALPPLPTALSTADPVAPVQIAAAPGRVTLLSADGHTWMLQNQKWLPLPGVAGAGYP